MKVLYAIQGTGNGHISRANEIIPILERRVNLDVLVSGKNSTLKLNYPVKYNFKGISFTFGKKGGIDFWKSLVNLKPIQFIRDVRSLNVNDYDLIISDFEPISAWACKLYGKECVGLSNQFAMISPETPKLSNFNFLHRLFLKYFCPVSIGYGIHYQSLGKKIFSPIIKKRLLKIRPEKLSHYTVYLPSYSVKKITQKLKGIKNMNFHVFTKEVSRSKTDRNFIFKPISQNLFIKSISTCEGVICNAGFETTSEAIYLKKKLLVIPMKNQFEQKYNAFCLKKMGYKTIKKLDSKKISKWIKSGNQILVDFDQETRDIVDRILIDYIKRLPRIPILPKLKTGGWNYPN